MSTFIIFALCRFHRVLWSGDLSSMSMASATSTSIPAKIMFYYFTVFFFFTAAPTAKHLQAPSRKTSSTAGCKCDLHNQSLHSQAERRNVGKAPASQNRLEFKTKLKEVKGGVSSANTPLSPLILPIFSFAFLSGKPDMQTNPASPDQTLSIPLIDWQCLLSKAISVMITWLPFFSTLLTKQLHHFTD